MAKDDKKANDADQLTEAKEPNRLNKGDEAALEEFRREAAADEGILSVPEGENTVLVFDGFSAKIYKGDDGEAARRAADPDDEDDASVTARFLPTAGVNRARLTEAGEIIPAAGAEMGRQSAPGGGSGGAPAARGTGGTGGTGSGTGGTGGGTGTGGSGT